MEIRSVGAAQQNESLPTSNFPHQMGEFGWSNRDKLQGTENKESWGSLALRYVLFIPNLVWVCVKRVVYVLTGGCFCNDAPTQKSVVKELAAVEKKWNDPAASDIEKKTAWATFTKNCPGGEEFLRDAYVEVHRKAALGEKRDNEEARNDWDKNDRKGWIEDFNRRLENLDGSLLSDYLANVAKDQ